MTAQIDPNYKIDRRTVRYQPPASAMSELVQRPAYLITPEAVIAAYMADWREGKP